MRNQRLRNFWQNAALVLLTLSALFLLARLPMLQNIRWSSQVPGLFTQDPAPGGQEEAALPDAMFPSMDLLVTGDNEYGRYGRLCVSADDASLQPVTPLFREALGSATPAGAASDAAFRAAMNGAGLYLALTSGELPLEAAAAWLGEQVDFDQSVQAMALAAGEADAAGLYLLDGGGGITRYDTALPASAVRTVCESFSPNGAYFSYETAVGRLEPYSVLTADLDSLPDIQWEVPAGYSVYNLLTALGFNAHTLSRYTESGGAEVVEESPRTLRITPDGTVTLISRGTGGPSLYRSSGTGLRETLSAAWRLASALTEGTGASPLHLRAVEAAEGGYTLRFRYQAEGVPVFFSDESDALTVTYQDGAVTSFTYRCRVYTVLEEEPAAALLPAGIAQAIAATYPGSRLSIGYADDGSGRLSAQWLR